MKIPICILLLSALFLCGAATAAEVDTDAGTVAALFEFRGLDSLGLDRYEGGVGVRWFPLARWAVRPGIAYGWSQRQTDYTDDQGSGYRGLDDESDHFEFQVILERHLAPAGPVSPYVGVGVGARTSTVTRTYSYGGEPDDGDRLKVATEGDSWSAIGVAGFEVRIYRQFTLGAEYRIEYVDGTQKTTEYLQNAPSRVQDGDDQSIAIHTSALLVGVRF